jgi:hypothetical protein
LFLAYLIVGLGALTLVGAVTQRITALALGSVFGWLAATIHAISFLMRSRRRRAPGELLGSARAILAVTLAALAAAALGNLLAVMFHVGRSSAAAAHGGTAAALAIAVIVLAWRAWLVPSARRAAVLQICATWIAVPAMFRTVVEAKRSMPGAWLSTSLFVSFVVVGCAGAALDKLFASVHDRGSDVVPRAIVR